MNQLVTTLPRDDQQKFSVDAGPGEPAITSALDALLARFLSDDVIDGMRDLRDFLRAVRSGVSRERWLTIAAEIVMRHPIAEVPLALYGALKEARAPTLAIVQGEAIGVGCALAAVCDMTLAADDAVFQVPELNHNIAPTLVMWALINRVPYKTAAYLVYSRERISAQRAEFLGLVTKVIPAAELESEAVALSQSLLSRAATSLQGIKDFLKFGSRMDPASASAYSATLNAAVSASAPREPHR